MRWFSSCSSSSTSWSSVTWCPHLLLISVVVSLNLHLLIVVLFHLLLVLPFLLLFVVVKVSVDLSLNMVVGVQVNILPLLFLFPFQVLPMPLVLLNMPLYSYRDLSNYLSNSISQPTRIGEALVLAPSISRSVKAFIFALVSCFVRFSLLSSPCFQAKKRRKTHTHKHPSRVWCPKNNKENGDNKRRINSTMMTLLEGSVLLFLEASLPEE